MENHHLCSSAYDHIENYTREVHEQPVCVAELIAHFFNSATNSINSSTENIIKKKKKKNLLCIYSMFI